MLYNGKTQSECLCYLVIFIFLVVRFLESTIVKLIICQIANSKCQSTFYKSYHFDVQALTKFVSYFDIFHIAELFSNLQLFMWSKLYAIIVFNRNPLGNSNFLLLMVWHFVTWNLPKWFPRKLSCSDVFCGFRTKCLSSSSCRNKI